MYFFWLLIAKYRIKKNKEDKFCINEKFGIANKQALKQLEEYKKECKKQNIEAKVVAIHAVSVGESKSALLFVRKMLDMNFFVVFTTTTVTSANLIKQKLTKNFVHQYSVYPCKTFIKKFYNNWKPSYYFFIENEIFPSIITFLKKQNCKIYLLNARMSAKSYKHWSYVKFYIGKIFAKYDCIFAQSEEEAEKFKKLSNFKSKVECFGNLKIDESIRESENVKYDFENNINNDIIAKCKLLKKKFEGKKIIVFSSIHESEFFYLIWQYSLLLKKMDCIGVFAPRYLEEVRKLEEYFSKNDIKTIFFSEFCDEKFSNTIILDIFGVLNYIYNICDYSVIGGSFAEGIGGHNPLESLSFNKPTIIGKYFEKNKCMINDLINQHAIMQTSEVLKEILMLNKNSDLEKDLINNGKKFFLKNHHITDKIINYLNFNKKLN